MAPSQKGEGDTYMSLLALPPRIGAIYTLIVALLLEIDKSGLLIGLMAPEIVPKTKAVRGIQSTVE